MGASCSPPVPGCWECWGDPQAHRAPSPASLLFSSSSNMHHPLLSKKDFPPFFKGKAEIFISLILCLPQTDVLVGQGQAPAKPPTQKNGIKVEKIWSTNLCLPWHRQPPLPQLHQTPGGLETPQLGTFSAITSPPLQCSGSWSSFGIHGTDPTALSPRCPLSPVTAGRPSLGSAREKTLSMAEPVSRKCRSRGTACEHHSWQHCPSQELLLPGPASRIVLSPFAVTHKPHPLETARVSPGSSHPLPSVYPSPVSMHRCLLCPHPPPGPLQRGMTRLVKLSPPVSQHGRCP